MRVAVGHSEDIDTLDALKEILEECSDQLGSVDPQAGLLFAGIDHDHPALVGGVMDRYPGLELIGATTDGEISSVLGFSENSVTLILFQSDTVHFATGVGYDVMDDPARAGADAARMALAGLEGEPRLCIATPDGLLSDLESVLNAIGDALPDGVTTCGGLAGDQFRLTETYQFHKRDVLTQTVPLLLFSDPILLSSAVGGGWQPIGSKHVVTESQGVLVKKIDDKPAVELYEEYMGGFSTEHPLIVFPDESERSFISSGMASKDGDIIFRIAVPAGSRIQLSTVSRDDVVEGAASAAVAAVKGYPGSTPAAGLIFSCAGRRQVLGTRVVEEYEALRANLGRDLPICGFYTYGEICPLAGDTRPQAHDSTFVTVLIGED